MAKREKKPTTFKGKLEIMTPAELEELKENLFSEIQDAQNRTRWRTLESLNMKIHAVGHKIMQVASVLYSKDSEDYKVCQERVFSLSPHYRKKTEEEKNEALINRTLNELDAENNDCRYISSRVQTLAARQLYISAEREKE